jgi:hypothetical protein
VTDLTLTTDWPADEPEIGWEQFARNWLETARHFSQNADYWRDRAKKAEAEVRALRDQRDEAISALREIEYDDLYLLTLGGLGQFRANTLATVRRALAAVDRPPTGTPDTGDDT